MGRQAALRTLPAPARCPGALHVREEDVSLGRDYDGPAERLPAPVVERIRSYQVVVLPRAVEGNFYGFQVREDEVLGQRLDAVGVRAPGREGESGEIRGKRRVCGKKGGC